MAAGSVAAQAKSPGGLLTRVVVGVALAAVAIAAVWAGGLAFTALVMAAVLLMSAEWSVMHGVSRGFRLASLAALAFSGLVATTYGAPDALVVLAASAGAIGLFVRGFDRKRAFWVAAGLLYCGLPMVALLWLRAVPDGLENTLFVLVVVWATDIGAFFAGRAIGGPKFVPAISPNKTWSGVAGGLVAAVVAGVVAVAILDRLDGVAMPPARGGTLVITIMAAAFLAVVAVLGDVGESWLKRRAGVKDSGTLLPGHGGVMDRIDGLVPVAVVAAALAYAGGMGR